MGTIVISKKIKTYKFTYNNYKGSIIFVGNKVESMEDCFSSIDFLKNNFDAVVLEQEKTASGKFFFRLLFDGTSLGVSRKFTTPLLMEKAISDFQKNFVNSEILDFTQDIFNTNT